MIGALATRAKNIKSVAGGNMVDNKKEITSDVMLADLMLRVTSLETILVSKGIFTKEEFSQINEEIAKKVAKIVLEKTKTSKEADDFIANLEANKDKN
jgi:hypothetical protein